MANGMGRAGCTVGAVLAGRHYLWRKYKQTREPNIFFSVVQTHMFFYDCAPLGLVEITIVMGSPTSMRCMTKMPRLALRIGSSSELSTLAVKKSGANGGVTRSSLYLPRSGETVGPTPSAFDLA